MPEMPECAISARVAAVRGWFRYRYVDTMRCIPPPVGTTMVGGNRADVNSLRLTSWLLNRPALPAAGDALLTRNAGGRISPRAPAITSATCRGDHSAGTEPSGR